MPFSNLSFPSQLNILFPEIFEGNFISAAVNQLSSDLIK